MSEVDLQREHIRQFEYAGELFSIPFELREVEGAIAPIAWADDIGLMFHDEVNRRAAAEKINQTARRNKHIFDKPGYRTAVFKKAADGKLRKVWAYTKKGVIALGLKSRKDKAHKFVEFCIEVMEALLEGKTVKLVSSNAGQLVADGLAGQDSSTKASAIGIAEHLEMAKALVGNLQATTENRAVISALKEDVSEIRMQLAKSKEQTLQILDSRISSERLQPWEYSKERAAEIFGLFVPSSGLPASGFIGALMHDYDFLAHGLARKGLWEDDESMKLHEGQFLNQKGMQRLEDILCSLNLPRYKAIKITAKARRRNVIYKPSRATVVFDKSKLQQTSLPLP